MSGLDKNTRILKLYNRLMNGEVINKTLFSVECGVSERAIDRDIEDIRLYLSEEFSTKELLFDRTKNGYFMSATRRELLINEIIPILKILLDSEAFRLDELSGITETLISGLNPMDIKKVKTLIGGELQRYPLSNDKKALLKILRDLDECILNRVKIKLCFNKNGQDKEYITVSPATVLFINRYFYLIAFIDEKANSVFFNTEYIESFEVLNQSVFLNPGQIIDVKELKDIIKMSQYNS